MADKILTVDELIQVLKGRKYKYSQVHHTYQPDHADFNGKNHLELQQGMRNYHVNVRGWDDIGQHVTLMPDGLFVTGRDFDKDLIDFDDTPAGIVGYNTGAFMCEMLGNFDLGHDKLQGKQLDSMLKLQHFLITECRAEILFHREKANKSCPGTGIDKGWFIQQVATYANVPTPQVASVNESTPQPQPTPKEDNRKVLIKTIQSTVNARYGLSIAVDGIPGPETRKALLKGLQTELNRQFDKRLVVDGIWGPRTSGACVSVRKGARGNISWIVQALLYCAGYDPKGLDGIFGGGTSGELLVFQRDRGLTQNAIADRYTFQKLFAA